MVEINKNKLIKELKFWNIFCLCAFIICLIFPVITSAIFKIAVMSSPLILLIFNVPLFIGLMFLIPFNISSNILDKIDDNVLQ
jgi:hypothetical protein